MPDSESMRAEPSALAGWSWPARLQWLLVAIATLGLMPLYRWLAWHESDYSQFGSLIMFWLVIVMAAAVMGLPVSLIFCFIPRYQRKAAWLLLCSAVAVACFFFGEHVSQPIKQNALKGVMTRAEPLIAAIRKFEVEHGKPPPDLTKLVPSYLPTMPTPGIKTSPEYYFRLPTEHSPLEGNAWMLEVRPPVAGIGFDVFIYLPNQNYPERGWGGVLERIGTWAYVHE